MVREFQGYGAYFLIYEYLFQNAMSREQKKRSEVESWKSCLYGAAAGLYHCNIGGIFINNLTNINIII